MLDLSGNEKRSAFSDGKTKSLQQRWFSTHSKAETEGEHKENNKSSSIFIQWDSLVTMKCKRDQHESIKKYWVLAMFTKYYNK